MVSLPCSRLPVWLANYLESCEEPWLRAPFLELLSRVSDPCLVHLADRTLEGKHKQTLRRCHLPHLRSRLFSFFVCAKSDNLAGFEDQEFTHKAVSLGVKPCRIKPQNFFLRKSLKVDTPPSRKKFSSFAPFCLVLWRLG